MSMLVETADQYLDIFQNLKDEVTTKKLPPGYYDLDPIRRRYDGDIDLDSERPSLSEQEDEFIYPEDYDEEEEVEVVAYYTDIVTPEDEKDAHDSTKDDISNSSMENKSQQEDAKHLSLPLD